MLFEIGRETAQANDSEIVSLRQSRSERRIALIGTFPPRKCGIATFTSDVVEQLTKFAPQVDTQVWALDPEPDSHIGAVVGQIDTSNPRGFAAIAHQINADALDAVWLQHEFGIFGGPDGEFVLDLVNRLAAPLIITFHTVLKTPSVRQRKIMDHLISRASRIMVMSDASRDILVDLYRAPSDRITVIEHGAPDRPFGREEQFKAARGLSGRSVLTTFGLLGPGKGLETVIEALPAIIATHPDTIYRIVGATHPNLVAREGERYRDSLVALAERLGIGDAIEWEGRFLEVDELLDQLEACDIYLTPYPNLQQSTSGTLSYAVALGKAVVSTPYAHAKQLLANEVGVLVEPGRPEAIAEAVCRLLAAPTELAGYKKRAWERGRTTIWPRFAASVAKMIDGVVVNPAPIAGSKMPSFDAVARMCDKTGMLQHSIGIVPDRRHGYCLDDNVRALMLVNVTKAIGDEERVSRALVHASFIQHAWNSEVGAFRNFMSYDRNWCEERGSDDSNGRTVWALARTVRDNCDADLQEWAANLYDEVLPAFSVIDSPRALAFIMIGAATRLRDDPDHLVSRKALLRGGGILAHLVERSRRPDWPWFEAVLAYDNPRLPQALLEAGTVLGREEWVELGLETLAWICGQQTAANGCFRPIGSESFGEPYDHRPFDQQPLEAQAALEACATAFSIDRNERWREHGLAAWNWFFGGNDRGAILADPVTGLCRDGITPRGVNSNCGAESILAFQLGYEAMLALVPGRDARMERKFARLSEIGAQSVAYS